MKIAKTIVFSKQKKAIFAACFNAKAKYSDLEKVLTARNV